MAIGISLLGGPTTTLMLKRGRLFWVGGGASVTTAYNDS